MEELWKNHCPICVELQLNSEFLNDSSWCDRLHQPTGMALKSPIMATFPGHDRPTVPRADLSVLASKSLNTGPSQGFGPQNALSSEGRKVDER